jgi:hypothetical protein
MATNRVGLIVDTGIVVDGRRLSDGTYRIAYAHEPKSPSPRKLDRKCQRIRQRFYRGQIVIRRKCSWRVHGVKIIWCAVQVRITSAFSTVQQTIAV